MLRILIADDEPAARFGMVKALRSPDYEISEAADGRQALETIRGAAPDLVFLDLDMPLLDGQGILREIGQSPVRSEIIVVTADDNVQSAVECMRLGAADYIAKPYEIEQLRSIARRAAKRVDLEGRLEQLQSQLDQRQAFGALVGVSRPMRELFSQMERAARAAIDVLIQGETGTGKELIAREIHKLSPRADGPFIAVNTAAIAESLAESELFGHQRGAFTGADADRQGVFEQAHGGTLFLDEIGDMPLPTQTKILRVLQERVVQPVGSSRRLEVDVRVLTATHQDLPQAIQAGHFREDLYYRIRGVELRVPALRYRREDIILLAEYFLQRLPDLHDGAKPRLSTAAIDRLLVHPWPGNVRELGQMITAAAAMAAGDEIQPADLNLPAPDRSAAVWSDQMSELEDLPLTDAKNRLVESFERRAIRSALDRHDGNISAAARQLGIHRQSLQQKMAQWDIRRE